MAELALSPAPEARNELAQAVRPGYADNKIQAPEGRHARFSRGGWSAAADQANLNSAIFKLGNAHTGKAADSCLFDAAQI